MAAIIITSFELDIHVILFSPTNSNRLDKYHTHTHTHTHTHIYIYIYIYIYIQGVTGGTDQTSGECSVGQTIPISKVERLQSNWPEKRVDFFGVCVLYSFP